MRAVVIDQRTSFPVQICRELSHRGYEVDAFAEPRAPILRSRYCARRLASPPWYADSFREVLERTVATGGYDVIYVCSESILETLVPTLDASAGAWAGLPHPAPTKLHRLFSKNAVMEQVGKWGVPIPRTLVPQDESDVLPFARELGGPVVVKGEKGVAAQNVRIARTRDAVLPFWREIKARERRYDGQPALQEFVSGDTYLVGAVVDRGRTVRLVAHKKELMFPQSGGATVRAVTERHGALVDAALAVFEALDYTGIGSLDFIRDARDGTFRFLEINPRPWASIGLGFEATDLIGAYHDVAKGIPVAADLRYRTGLVYHRLSGELHLMRQRPSRIVGFVKDCLNPDVMSDFDPSDVRPYLPRF